MERANQGSKMGDKVSNVVDNAKELLDLGSSKVVVKEFLDFLGKVRL